ncbi:hypothetical protein [Streptomyces canus]|uniref:hypothetical protein n=1 Tax=Streptomyces canus TaxID=58343 RepID=UPI0036E9FEE1
MYVVVGGIALAAIVTVGSALGPTVALDMLRLTARSLPDSLTSGASLPTSRSYLKRLPAELEDW